MGAIQNISAAVCVILCVVGVEYYSRISSHIQECNDVIVTLATHKGKVKGHVLQSAKGNNYYAFQDIPYAVPPIGLRRYKVPRTHPGWTGVLDATENRVVCVQSIPTNLPQSEDCLHVNVYTPVKPGSNKNLAVYVWIHGGGYIVWDGSISRYNPIYLMDYNIVVVTLNYRLGALGFLATDDGVIPGNLGLRDQSLALKWIHKNIQQFGGDPSKITIGGESAGASSVSFQILSQMSRGLFRGAILQSGSAINTFSYVPSPSIYAFKLGQLLDSRLDPQNTTQLLEVLQKADVKDLTTASTKVAVAEIDRGVGLVNDLIWAPTLERHYTVTPFVSKPMHEAFIQGDFAQVPQLIGFTSEEMLWFMPSSPVASPWRVNTYSELRDKATYIDEDPARLVNNKLNINMADKASAGTLFKQLYTNLSFAEDTSALVKMSSDFMFNHGIIRQAQTSSKYVPVYLFQFSFAATGSGAPHTEELQYFWKGDQDVGDLLEFQSILRDRLCKLWTNFIKYLNPTPEPDEDFENIIWPKTQPDDIKYVNLNKTLEVRTNPRQYYEITKILKKYIKAPLIVY